MKKKLILFTDLDGTLLDKRYSFNKASASLELIKKKDVPLVISSSKTRAEIETFREKIANSSPFISENGGGLFIPKKHIKFESLSGGNKTADFKIEIDKKYFIIKLGADYHDLRVALGQISVEGFNIKGFGDMSAREVAKVTGLSLKGAGMARKREFDEPFIFYGSSLEAVRLKRLIKRMGLNYTEGEFYHLIGDSDKGRGVTILKEIYNKRYPKIISAALGDSPNDIEMLKSVDFPIVVQKEDGNYHERLRNKGFIMADGVGPEGWNNAVIKLLETLGI